MILSAKVSDSLQTSTQQQQQQTTTDTFTVGAYPTSLDYRNDGIVSPPKNQRTCGSCWAFASAGYIEGLYALEGQGLKDVAEQQMLECAFANGCSGGNALSGSPVAFAGALI